MSKTTKKSEHQSILKDEIVTLLSPVDGGYYADATFGGGGHSQALLDASVPNGRVIAFDADSSVNIFADQLSEQYPNRFDFKDGSYTELVKYPEAFDGIVFDLGLSSDQLSELGRGFSFQRTDDLLDIRFDATCGQTAGQFLNQASIAQIERVFKDYAEDRYWKVLSRKILESRRAKPIRTVGDFVALVGSQDPKVLAPLFQALRIQVNDELNNVRRGLQAAQMALKVGGRLAVISFHSLEDRIVKEFLRQEGWQVLTKKPITPSSDEVLSNPRSRSAKLRVAQKISS